MFRSRLFTLLLASAASVFAVGDDNQLTDAEKAEGWKLLFDGTATPGLRGLQKPDFLKAGWEIKNDALVLPKSVRQSGTMTGGDLVTSEQFADFEFRFDFKFTASANSGILYFARGGLGMKPSGHEYQIIDDVHHPDGLKGGPLRRTGALYGVLPPSDDKKLNISDSWNTGAIIVQGNHVEHWLNGDKVHEYECNSAALTQAVRASKAKVPQGFGMKIKSSLAILDKGEEVAFRNLKIRLLSPTPAPPPPALTAPPTPPQPTEPGDAAPMAKQATPIPATPVAPVRATPPPRPAFTLPPPPPPPTLKP